MAYIDGFVLPLPTGNVEDYRRLSKQTGKVWMEHGALSYRECIADDIDLGVGVPFTRLAKTRPDETVVFAYIEYKSRAHRDRVNAKVMADPRMDAIMGGKMPFDVKRMAHGGFEVIVDARSSA